LAEDKQKALELAVTSIERHFGKGAIMRLGSTQRLAVNSISTGSLPLDIALGVGGIPRGRITEIFGQEASGKTTLGYHIVAEAQRAGGAAAFVDAEHAVDPSYAEQLGVNVDDLLVSQPDTGEEALEIMDTLIRSGAIDAVVLDSVAALVPKSEIEGEMGDSHVGLQARLMSQALRKLGGSVSKSNTAAVFINQVREKIGVIYGNPEVTPGGRALKFWASVRLDVRRVESIKRGTDVLGARTRVKAGTWFTYGEIRLGQGRENAKAFIEANPDLMEELDGKAREAAGLRREAFEPPEPAADSDAEAAGS
jgi:recombination protein RecA